MNKTATLIIILFVASLIYNLPIIKMPVKEFDEGIILAGAERIHEGEVPYQDFYSFYPPGQFYTLACLFKFFGTTILVERILDLLVKSFLAVMSFLLTLRMTASKFYGLLAWIMTLLWVGFSGFPGYPVYPAMLTIFLSTYCFFNYLEYTRLKNIFIAGVFIGICSSFRIELAVFTGLATGSTLLLRRILRTDTTLKPMGIFILGVMSSILPIWLPLVVYVGLQTIADQLVFSLYKILPMYWLPYPTSLSPDTYHFLIFPGLTAIAFLISIIQISAKQRNFLSYSIFQFSLLGLLFFQPVITRADDIHILRLALVCITIIPSLLSLALKLPFRNKYSKFVTYFIFFLGLAILFIKPIAYKSVWIKNEYKNFLTRSVIERAGYSALTPDLTDVLLFIQDTTHHHEPIYVGVTNHDRFLATDTIIYFLSDRDYPTRYHILLMGITDLPETQKEIVGEIEQNQVIKIILTQNYWYEPNDTRFDPGYDIIDNYIRDNYELIKTIGIYEVWQRKNYQ